MTRRSGPRSIRRLAEANVFTYIRCGGSGGRCNAIYGAVVDDGTDIPPVLYRTGQPCHHHVNAYALDWAKLAHSSPGDAGPDEGEHPATTFRCCPGSNRLRSNKPKHSRPKGRWTFTNMLSTTDRVR